MSSRTVTLSLPRTLSLDIEFSSIAYEVSSGFRGPSKTILNHVNGNFKAGELTAIMGPSGAGKSSLLNILTGYNQFGVKGCVSYRGHKGKCDWSKYSNETCYIQQDDQLDPLFTVNETMNLATDLKLGITLSKKAKQMVIDDILDTLDLSKTKDTRCCNLSGGQRKRLSIALELMDNPPVMFLDEPTTGLDSLASLQCVTLLRGLARGGRTIVCTIHQPSAVIYEMFDHVYLLAEGRCVYQGTPENTVSYFANLGLECPKYHNPADYMIEVVSKEYGDFNAKLANAAKKDATKWRTPAVLTKTNTYESIKDSMDNKRDEENKATVLVSKPSELTKFFVLLNRNRVQLYRDWTVTHLKIVLHSIVGALLGFLYGDSGSNGSKSINNISFLLVSLVYLCYTSMMPAILKFPYELPLLRKEQFNNWYKLRTYYMAAIVSNLPLHMIFCMVYTTISYFMTSQPPEWDRFARYLIISVLTTFIAESIGLFLGSVFTPVNGTFLGSIYTCAMLLFAGFLVLFNHMSDFMQYISYLSYLKYSLEGLVITLYGYNRAKLDCPVEELYCHFRHPEMILNEMAMSNVIYWVNMITLLIYVVLLRILTYCTLKRKLLRP